MIWKSFLRVLWRHAIIIVIPNRVDGSPPPSAAVCEHEHLMMSQFNKNLTLSHQRPHRWPLEGRDTPWYWPRLVLLHFLYSSWVTCPLWHITPKFIEKILHLRNFEQDICHFNYKLANFARISYKILPIYYYCIPYIIYAITHWYFIAISVNCERRAAFVTFVHCPRDKNMKWPLQRKSN